MPGHGSRGAVLVASSVLAVALAGAVSYAALPGAAPAGSAPRAAATDPGRPFGATCRTAVEGSGVVSYCHNPYPEPDHVRLHTECVRWWDIDGDSAATAVGPAQTVRLTGRCWKEIGSAWVTHSRTPAGPAPAPGARPDTPAGPAPAP
ncbi:hypothetical protein ACFYVL_37160 [Streptomyces sp. NPDC004111]|uniref:hypothetical protein n=1 Tax=Streptomyces sp. NPDC004111 TaxID=3364690 RepID=UPI0036846602